MEAFGNVEVAIRVRPMLQKESDTDCVTVDSTGGIELVKPEVKIGGSVIPPQGSRWAFDHAFGREANNKQVFEKIGLPSVQHAFQGYHACILAYGQTGSGKTYTMEGTDSAQPGLISQLCKTLFEKSEERKRGKGWDFQAEVSYVEIYNEKVRCLLQPKCSDPRIREHPVTGPYVDGATKCAVNSADEIQKLLKRAGKTRTVAATKNNDRSSRSHALFVVTYTQIEGNGDTTCEKESRMTLVDLAGSERACGTEVSTKEGSNINKSLATLGKVINILSEREGSTGSASPTRRHVPYRDSSLTWMLRESLGGNSKTTVLCTLSPGLNNFDQSVSTLRFAERAKAVVTTPVVNEDPSKKRIRMLISEVEILKQQLSQQGDVVPHPTPASHPDTPDYNQLPPSHRLKETEAVLQILKEEWGARMSQFTSIHRNQMESLTKSVEKQHSLGTKLQEIVGTLQTKDATRNRRQSLELHRIREALEEVKSLVKNKTRTPPVSDYGAGIVSLAEDNTSVRSVKSREEPLEDPPVKDDFTIELQAEGPVSQPHTPGKELFEEETFTTSSRKAEPVMPACTPPPVLFANEQPMMGDPPTEPPAEINEHLDPEPHPPIQFKQMGMGVPVSLPKLSPGPKSPASRQPPPPHPHPTPHTYQTPVRTRPLPTPSPAGWGVVFQALSSRYGTLELAANNLRRDGTSWVDLGLLAHIMKDASLDHLTTPFIAALDKHGSGNVSVTELRAVLGDTTCSVRRRECSPEHKLADMRESSCSTSLPLPSEACVTDMMSAVHVAEIERLKEENKTLQKSFEDQQKDTTQLKDDIGKLTQLVQGSVQRQEMPEHMPQTESRSFSPKGKGGLLTSPQPPMNPCPTLGLSPYRVERENQEVVAVELQPPPPLLSEKVSQVSTQPQAAKSEWTDEYVDELRKELQELVQNLDASQTRTGNAVRRAEEAVELEQKATEKLIAEQKKTAELALKVESLENEQTRAQQEIADLRKQLFRRTQQKDTLQKEQQRWEADIASARRENIKLERETVKMEQLMEKLGETEEKMADVRDCNLKLVADNKNQARLLKHREAKSEREREQEIERQEMVKKTIVEAASAEVEKLRTDLADLTQICASQQELITGLQGEVGESKQTVKVVKEVGDNAINTLTETLKVTLERLEVHEANEMRVTATHEELDALSNENADLKSMVATLESVVKQQMDSLAEKELQLMRVSKLDDPPPNDITDASPQWRRFLNNDFVPHT
eukprot:TRINITY_DN9176_c0_g1_i2.p1 TRINITY_DN9176_c0_g1~~TRINITY_DN9176_c0_g1_i2.p1  ORF type:complete len:1240 (+),score=293.53 TRINITY_DN9176_c0_g1_i2:85-3804(+)